MLAWALRRGGEGRGAVSASCRPGPAVLLTLQHVLRTVALCFLAYAVTPRGAAGSGRPRSEAGSVGTRTSPPGTGAECVLTRRSPEDLSRFIVELQQRELALKDKNGSLANR